MGVPEKSLMTSAERIRRIQSVLWIELALNIFVASLKILFGWATHTMVIVADGFHSLSDGTFNIIGFVAIHLSGRPADEKHPYGRHKYETLASVVLAALLLVVAVNILQHAVAGFFEPRAPEVGPLSFVVMTVTFIVNIFVFLWERRQAKQLDSDYLTSDAAHTLSDIFVTIGVFVALAGISLNFPVLDSIFSVGIAFVIGWVAFGILKHSSDILTDKAVLDPRVIEGIVRGLPEVAACHEVRTRGNRHAIYVDLHVLVEPSMSVEASHHLANRIERDIRERIEGVQDVVVHIEPTTHDHSELAG